MYGLSLFGDRPHKRPERDTDRARLVDLTTQYDLLGPLAREAIQESPLDLHVGQMLNAAPLDLMADDGWGWDDKRLAAWIRQQIVRKVGRDPEYFKLVPRRVMTGAGRRGALPPVSRNR